MYVCVCVYVCNASSRVISNKRSVSMKSCNRMNIYIYACIINIEVPHEVKYQRAKAKRTSQIM